jgi:hypothetical protein
MKCAMSGCNCNAQAGKTFCSPACETNSRNEKGKCACGHPGCNAKAEQRMLEPLGS